MRDRANGSDAGVKHECEAPRRVQKGTYRSTDGPTRHRDLNDLVPRENVDTPSGEEFLRGPRSSQNLQQYRHRGLVERGSVDLELQGRDVKDDVHVERHISGSERRSSWGSGVGERVQVGFVERVAIGRLGRSRVGVGGTDVPEDGRVDTASEALSTDVGVGANPVIGDGLVGSEYERVTLTGKDVDAVDSEWLDAYSVDLNDRLGDWVSRCQRGSTRCVPWCDCRWKIHNWGRKR